MSENPYLVRKKKQRIGHHGRKSEKRVAKKLRADLTPASGATRGKGDMNRDAFLIEAKATVKKILSLEHEWLIKIAQEAAMAGKTPALTVSFVMPGGKPWAEGEWALVPLSLFEEMLNG